MGMLRYGFFVSEGMSPTSLKELLRVYTAEDLK